jgi:hypothetical protein
LARLATIATVMLSSRSGFQPRDTYISEKGNK